jgi:hypothetical protein
MCGGGLSKDKPVKKRGRVFPADKTLALFRNAGLCNTLNLNFSEAAGASPPSRPERW